FDQRLPRRRHIYKTSARRHADGLRAHESISGGDARNLSLMPAGSKHFQDILFWIGLDAQRSCPAVILSGNSYLLLADSVIRYGCHDAKVFMFIGIYPN